MSATMLYTAGEAKPARLFVCDAGRTMRTVDIGQGITLGRAGTGIDGRPAAEQRHSIKAPRKDN